MDCKTTSITKARRRAFTLVELLVSSGISSIFVMAVAYLTFYSARSYVAMTNYIDLEVKSRSTLDTMSKEIRQASSLSSYNTTNLTFLDSDGQMLYYNYNSNAQTLTRVKNNQSKVLLEGCESLTFGVYQRNPTNDFNVVATTSPALCKLIQLNWKCSRSILKAKVNTESVQSAKIVIRKQ